MAIVARAMFPRVLVVCGAVAAALLLGSCGVDQRGSATLERLVGSSGEAGAALEDVVEQRDAPYVAALVELLRAAEIGIAPDLDPAQVGSALDRLTGERFARDWNAWVEWYARTDLEPPAGGSPTTLVPRCERMLGARTGSASQESASCATSAVTFGASERTRSRDRKAGGPADWAVTSSTHSLGSPTSLARSFTARGAEQPIHAERLGQSAPETEASCSHRRLLMRRLAHVVVGGHWV